MRSACASTERRESQSTRTAKPRLRWRPARSSSARRSCIRTSTACANLFAAVTCCWTRTPSGSSPGPYDTAHTLVVDPILTYGSYIGGTGDETIETATTGPDGSLYLSGYTTSPALFGQTKPGNWADVFVIKLLPGGGAVDFVTYIGGGNDDYGFGSPSIRRVESSSPAQPLR